MDLVWTLHGLLEMTMANLSLHTRLSLTMAAVIMTPQVYVLKQQHSLSAQQLAQSQWLTLQHLDSYTTKK